MRNNYIINIIILEQRSSRYTFGPMPFHKPCVTPGGTIPGTDTHKAYIQLVIFVLTNGFNSFEQITWTFHVVQTIRGSRLYLVAKMSCKPSCKVCIELQYVVFFFKNVNKCIRWKKIQHRRFLHKFGTPVGQLYIYTCLVPIMEICGNTIVYNDVSV